VSSKIAAGPQKACPYYSRYLGRAADQAGLASWLSALQARATDQALLAGILGSPEGWPKKPGTGARQAVYSAAVCSARVGTGSRVTKKVISGRTISPCFTLCK
jgi:hypothetical protein